MAALENVTLPVNDGGMLFIAIYNDQGKKSQIWCNIKKIYCSGIAGRILVSAIFIPCFIVFGILLDLTRGRNPLTRYTEYKKSRGMSITHDWFDWLGGYPFEVAKPEVIFRFYKNKNFILKNLITCGGSLGNNEFVFIKQ